MQVYVIGQIIKCDTVIKEVGCNAFIRSLHHQNWQQTERVSKHQLYDHINRHPYSFNQLLQHQSSLLHFQEGRKSVQRLSHHHSNKGDLIIQLPRRASLSILLSIAALGVSNI